MIGDWIRRNSFEVQAYLTGIGIGSFILSILSTIYGERTIAPFIFLLICTIALGLNLTIRDRVLDERHLNELR